MYYYLKSSIIILSIMIHVLHSTGNMNNANIRLLQVEPFWRGLVYDY